jgi:hypothetical protein
MFIRTNDTITYRQLRTLARKAGCVARKGHRVDDRGMWYLIDARRNTGNDKPWSAAIVCDYLERELND